MLKDASVNQDQARRHLAQLGRDEREALRQLSSTAYLAVGRLDDEACATLAAADLARRDPTGFWKIAPAGQALFDVLEGDDRPRLRNDDDAHGDA